MTYEKEFIAKITGMGTLGYDVDKIINVLDVEDTDQFRADFANKESDIAQAFQKGMDKSDYLIDSKIYELAKTGDIKAIELYDKRKNAPKQQRTTQLLFGKK